MRRVILLIAVIVTASASLAQPVSPEWTACETGAPEAQLAACSQIIQRNGEPAAAKAKAHYRRGNAHADLKDNAKALADYAEAIRLKPDYSDAYNARGIVYFDQGQFDKAIAEYDTALKLNPKNFRALTNRGNARTRKGQCKEAAADITAAIALLPDNPTLHANRAAAHLCNKNEALALADLDRALALDRRFVAAFQLRGLILLGRGEHQRAIADMAELIRQNPNDASAYFIRCNAYGLLAERPKALGDCNRAIALKPSDAEYLRTRAGLLASTGDTQKALADYDAAIGLDPKHAPTLAARGMIKLGLQEFSAAAADFAAAAQLDPASKRYPQLLADTKAAQEALAKRTAAQKGADGKTLIKRRIALVIGNSKYQGISPLANAARDAKDVAEALKAQGYEVFGYPKTDLTRAQMFEAVGAFQSAAATADLALVWYAGHGQEFDVGPEQSGNYLVPVDFGAADNVLEKAVPLSSLINAASPARALRVVIIDACRNNNLPSRQRGARGFRVEERSDMLIVFSTRAGRLADDGAGANSPFATAFLEELKTGGRADVRLFFGGVAERVDKLTSHAAQGQEPERIDRLRTREALSLVP